MSRTSLREQLRARAAELLPELEERPSRFGGALAFRRGQREVAHFHGPQELDLRLPAEVRRALADEPRAVFRHGRSEWVAFRFRRAADLPRALELLALASQAATSE